MTGETRRRLIAVPISEPGPRIWFDDPSRSRIVLVGIAPSPRTPPGRPALSPPPGEAPSSITARILEDLVGRPVPEVFATANLLERAGDEQDIEIVRDRAAATIDLLAGRRVIGLGRIVGRALTGLATESWFRWEPMLARRAISPLGIEVPRGEVATVPHPSGRNLWWNDPANRERARAFFRELLR